MSRCASNAWDFEIPPGVSPPLVQFRLETRDTGTGGIEGAVVSVNGSTVNIPISDGVCIGLANRSFMSFRVNVTYIDSSGTPMFKKYLIAGIVRPKAQLAEAAPPGMIFSGQYFENEMVSSAEPAMRTAGDPGDTGTGGGSTGA